MFKEYMNLIEFSNDYKIIDDRALLIHGDSNQIIKESFKGLSNKIDAVITDPPYKFKKSGGPLFGRKKSFMDGIRKNDLADGFNSEILEVLGLFANSSICFYHNDQAHEILSLYSAPDYNNALDELYPRYVNITWQKTNPIPLANKHYVSDCEYYIHAWRPPFYPQGKLSDLSRVITTSIEKNEYNHPTVKPQSIMRKCVINASCAGDVIIDPYMGTASTGVAALKLGRFFIGIEKEKEFFDIACNRIANISGILDHEDDSNQLSLFNQHKENTK